MTEFENEKMELIIKSGLKPTPIDVIGKINPNHKKFSNSVIFKLSNMPMPISELLPID